MATNIVMPTLGLTMTEGTIESWLVKEGDTVSQGDVVAEISSEKLSSPVESPVDGVILKIIHQEGELVPIKQAMAIIGEEGERVENESPQSGEVPEKKLEEGSSEATQPTVDLEISSQSTAEEGERIFATPLARKMATDKGINLRDVNGTGGNGRITRLDIERYVPTESAVPEQSAQAKAASASLSDVGAGLTGMRKTIAQRMMQSVHTMAQVTNQRKVDVTNLMEFRQDIKEKVGQPLTKGEISINTLVTKAVILSLQEHPQLNAWYHNGVHEIQESIHIGMATDVEEGLVVPVIQDADKMSLSNLASAIGEVSSQARQGTLPGNLYSGSTFTITNLGGSNIEYFTPIINLPEVAILGVGTLMNELDIENDGELIVRKKLPLSLTYDHQIIDGAPAARFLETLADYLNNPYKLIF